MEEVRKESEQKFQAVFTAAPDAIVIASDDSMIVEWNETATRIFGYEKSEVKGKLLTLIMPEEYRERHLRGVQRFKQAGLSNMVGHIVKLEGLRKNGEKFPIELSLSTYALNEKTFFAAIIRDISVRQSLEKENASLKSKVQLV